VKASSREIGLPAENEERISKRIKQQRNCNTSRFQQGDRSASRKRRENQENQAAAELQHQPGGKNRIAEDGAHDGRALANWAKDRRDLESRPERTRIPQQKTSGKDDFGPREL
jgi:hypothetical protein